MWGASSKLHGWLWNSAPCCPSTVHNPDGLTGALLSGLAQEKVGKPPVTCVCSSCPDLPPPEQGRCLAGGWCSHCLHSASVRPGHLPSPSACHLHSCKWHHCMHGQSPRACGPQPDGRSLGSPGESFRNSGSIYFTRLIKCYWPTVKWIRTCDFHVCVSTRITEGDHVLTATRNVGHERGTTRVAQASWWNFRDKELSPRSLGNRVPTTPTQTNMESGDLSPSRSKAHTGHIAWAEGLLPEASFPESSQGLRAGEVWLLIWKILFCS